MASHYPHLQDPRIHPDFTRRAFAVPTWETFEHQTQFTALRVFSRKDNRLIYIKEDLDSYTKTHRLGKVIWPVFSAAQADNLIELVREIKQRGFYLFDIWGYIPGNTDQAMWGQFRVKPEVVEMCQRELGDRFLGFDNGEQDGRYVAGYAPQQSPSPQDRFRQYLNFQRHFQRLCSDLGNKMTALVSLTFGHYFMKEGNHVLIGAETAQGLPNSQIYYAFIRGAGKQYGVLWFGNASIFNRWGWKTYESEGVTGSPENPYSYYHYGPTHGTSLALLKRLLYSHYLYNCVAVGFEQSWINEDNTEKRLINVPTPMELDRSKITLSPVGDIQAAAVKFVEREGPPGVMHAPVALLLDHFAGWTVPRHLYTSSFFQVWGSMPYDRGDFLTHGVFSEIYPGYEDSSYWHDERGFMSPTPYGDMADALLSDVPPWVLKQYGLVIAAGELHVDSELRDKLEAFVNGGGHLLVTANNAQRLWPDWKVGPPQAYKAGSRISWEEATDQVEPNAFELCPAALQAGMKVLARCGDAPCVAQTALGRGRVTLLLSPFGINTEPLYTGTPDTGIDKPLSSPFVLLEHVKRALGRALAEQQIFGVGEGLGFITCRKSAGEYTLGIFNNSVSARPFRIESLRGTIEQARELPLDQSEKLRVGYWPAGLEKNDPGTSDDATIAGGDVRLFRVRLNESDLRVLEPLEPPPPVRDRFVALRGILDLKEAVLRWPTFFQHCDGVKIDWSYLHTRDAKQVRRERDWLARQKLRIVVDFSPDLNHFPGLTLLDNLKDRYDESALAIDDVLDKMTLIGASHAVFSLHRGPENNCTAEQAAAGFLSGVGDLCRRARERGVDLFLQHHPHKWFGSVPATLQFISDVGAINLRFALNTAHLALTGPSLSEALAAAGERLGMLLLCAPTRDRFGQSYNAHAAVTGYDLDLQALPGGEVIRVLDADYLNWDAVYRDIRTVWPL